MFKRICILSLTSIIGWGIATTTIAAEQEEAKVEYLNSNDFENLKNDKCCLNSPIFYINKDFNNRASLKRNSEKQKNEIIEDNEKNFIAEEDISLAAKYDFKYNDIRYTGEIYANENDSMYHVEDKINEIMDEINNGTYFEGHNLENKSTK